MHRLFALQLGYCAATAMAASVLTTLVMTALFAEPGHLFLPHASVAEAPPAVAVPVEVRVKCDPTETPISGSRFTAHPAETPSALPLSLMATMEPADPRQAVATILHTDTGILSSYGVGALLAPRVRLVGISDGVANLVNDRAPEYLSIGPAR